MKRILCFFAALALAVGAFAQTAEEIVAKMDEVMSQYEGQGTAMTLDVKVPILGTMSTKTYTLGDKMYMEATLMGKTMRTWTDGTTTWVYEEEKNKIEISDDGKPSEESNDAEMLNDITDGYDVILKKETAEAWYIQCKKSKGNKSKDDPKTMDLVVAKGTYYPISLKASISGVTMTIRDFSFGVTEEQVTFNPAAYPDATIEDKRGQK